MAVETYTKELYRGLSTDEKPTTGVFLDSDFLETNTGKRFRWNGTIWIGAQVLHVSSTAPSAPVVSDLWVDTT